MSALDRRRDLRPSAALDRLLDRLDALVDALDDLDDQKRQEATS